MSWLSLVCHLGHPSVKKYSMNPASNKFDIVIVSSFLMTEAAYYLAHKFEASIVHYHTAQSSLFIVDHAVGQPNNPAFMPPLQLELSHPMTFYQRVISTLTTFAFDKLIRLLLRTEYARLTRTQRHVSCLVSASQW